MYSGLVRLGSIRLVGLGPFDDLMFRFGDESIEGDSRARNVTVVFGGGGVGKTTLLSAIAATRPGHAVVQARTGPRRDGPSFAVADWHLNDDDPERPHALRVVTPNALPESEIEREGGEVDPQAVVARRREQALFDRRAGEGGFVVVPFSAARWFSRAPVLIASAERTIGRYDVRTPASFDDATRADLSRETKQVLAHAGIAAALSRDADAGGLVALDRALHLAVDALLRSSGFSYAGVAPRSLEPVFDPGGVTFDELPAGARHLVALAALPLRALAAAYPTLEDPRRAEGVVLVDEVERQLDPPAQRALVPALREALPWVQWIVTTSSPVVAASADARETLALRRVAASRRVDLYDGDLARIH